MQRRTLLKLAAAGLTVWHLPVLAAAAKSKNQASKKFIWIILRGGMDSLHTVVPTFDADLMKQRGALVEPIQNTLLPLTNGFALHPDLSFCHSLFKKHEFAPVVAVATPYRERSHFDGQDLLEGGRAHKEYQSGWLGRAITSQHSEAIAIARSVPLSLRTTALNTSSLNSTPAHSQATARTWYPSNLPNADSDLYARLMDLYKNDPLLQQRLAEAIETNNMMSMERTKGRPKFPVLAKSCATLLKANNGPQCAMLEMGGWDTHNNLVNRLSRQFKELDAGLKTLKSELGKHWQDTAIVVATEFGRTVKNNGTKGSDHGTASAMFLAGGAIKGGKVYGQWPGLADNNLFEGRDLMPTSDTFAWTAALLQQHWNLNENTIKQIFPDTAPVSSALI